MTSSSPRSNDSIIAAVVRKPPTTMTGIFATARTAAARRTKKSRQVMSTGFTPIKFGKGTP